MLLDELLPLWHRREIHRARTDAAPDRLLRAAEDVRWQDVPTFRALMTVRAAGRRPGSRTIIEGMTSIGFRELARSDTEIAYGGIGRPWLPRGGMVRVADRESFVRFDEPGWARMAFNFRVAEGVLSTETRIQLTDAAARRAFGRYWLVIRPFSGLIRRVWLRAIVQAAS